MSPSVNFVPLPTELCVPILDPRLPHEHRITNLTVKPVGMIFGRGAISFVRKILESCSTLCLTHTRTIL